MLEIDFMTLKIIMFYNSDTYKIINRNWLKNIHQ